MINSIGSDSLNMKANIIAEYIFRPAEKNEVDAVYSLIEKRMRWMDTTGIRQWNVTNYLEAYPRAYYAAQQAAGNLHVLVSSTVVGAVVLLEEDERWSDRTDSPAFYVHNLATDPDVSSVGRFILSRIERFAVERRKRYVRLDCAADNAFLNGYYESLGYHLAGNCTDGPYIGNRREKEVRT